MPPGILNVDISVLMNCVASFILEPFFYMVENYLTVKLKQIC